MSAVVEDFRPILEGTVGGNDHGAQNPHSLVAHLATGKIFVGLYPFRSPPYLLIGIIQIEVARQIASELR